MTDDALLLELQQEMRADITHPQFLPKITKLLFPDVSGYDNVKLALLCLLSNQWDGKHRERIHILLYGKPGCGKTVLMEPLERNWGALYLSMDPTACTLRGDSRKEDGGARLFNQYHGGIITIDDIELMKGVNALRDVMEIGRYTVSKNGIHNEYDAQVRIVAATNDVRLVPPPIVSRFDLIFKFDYPTIQQSLDILHNLLQEGDETSNSEAYINFYFYMVQTHEPKVTDKNAIKLLVKGDLETYGIDKDEGKEGRWIAGILRLAKAYARIRLTDIGAEEIEWALAMKRQSDEVIKNVLKC